MAQRSLSISGAGAGAAPVDRRKIDGRRTTEKSSMAFPNSAEPPCPRGRRLYRGLEVELAVAG